MGKGDKTSQTGMKVLILVAMVAGTLIGLMGVFFLCAKEGFRRDCCKNGSNWICAHAKDSALRVELILGQALA